MTATQYQYDHQQKTPRTQVIDIGDGLKMRWSTKADGENIGRLLGEAFRFIPMRPVYEDHEVPPPNRYAAQVGPRSVSGQSAVMSEYDYAVVENTRAKIEEGENPLVACVSLHKMPGYYGKVKLQYGKPEVVGTHPAFRNRGLIRRLFMEMINPATDARGDLIQVFPGIDYFYRQFQYEYGITNEPTRKMTDLEKNLPKLAEGESEPIQLREIDLTKDLPYLLKMSAPEKVHRGKSDLGNVYDEDYWHFTVGTAYQPDGPLLHDFLRISRILVDPKDQTDVGVVVLMNAPTPTLNLLSIDETRIHYHAILDSVLRQLIYDIGPKVDAAEYAREPDLPEEQRKREPARWKAIRFGFDEDHPVTQLIQHKTTRTNRGFKFYTRIASYTAFLQAVAPELEARLARSALAGISTTLRVNWYRRLPGMTSSGLEMVFKDGKLVSTGDWTLLSPEDWQPIAAERKAKGIKPEPELRVHFAPMTFTRILTGDTTLEAQMEHFPETFYESDEAKLLTNILFPRTRHHFDTFYW
ncbi:hypothetical protein BGZ73_009026 [Actinomortierella ambigua]|nr:hypothetical protein BGZ73_009026 [Actinomortierella ambigua]